MRRYDIATGILLIIAIIDFASAAPVSAQEKRQAGVDVVPIFKDAEPVLEERWEEEIEKLGEKYFKTGTPSSSSALSAPDHGSTNVGQQNPTSSAANPDSSMESPCSPSGSSEQGLSARGNCWGVLEAMSAAPIQMQHGPGPMVYIPPTIQDFGQYEKLPTVEEYEMKMMSSPRPSVDPSADPNFDWEGWINAEDPPSSLTPPPPPPRFKGGWGQSSGHGPSPPTTEPYAESYPGSVANSPPLGAGSPQFEVDPRPQSSPENPNPQPWSADSQPVDLQAITYAAKGKQKEIQRDLQLAGRSLEPET